MRNMSRMSAIRTSMTPNNLNASIIAECLQQFQRFHGFAHVMYAEHSRAAERGDDSRSDCRNEAVARFKPLDFPDVRFAGHPVQQWVAIAEHIFRAGDEVEIVPQVLAETYSRIEADRAGVDAEGEKLFRGFQKFPAHIYYNVVVGLEILLHRAEVSAYMVEYGTCACFLDRPRHRSVETQRADVIDDMRSGVHASTGDGISDRVPGTIIVQ